MEENPNIKIMERKAADNKYLHKDFHQSMNILLIYILETYGKEHLVEYLAQYATAYYKPLHDELLKGNLNALYQYLKDIYEKEEWPADIAFDGNEIFFSQDSCPAVTQIKKMGGTPCPFYDETYNTLYKTLCANTAFEYELLYFDDETGACKQTFKRKIQS